MDKKIVVTGGSGHLGKWVVREMIEHGYQVVNADTKYPKEPLCPTVIVDLNHLGEAYGVLAGAEAVIHLAAIPAAGIQTPEVTFQNNVVSTYNILEAAAGLGIQKAVIASSESSYGIVYAVQPLGPQYVPLDENHPQVPQDSYGLSKVVNELTADMFHRRSNMQIVSFRLGNVISPEQYANFPGFIHDPKTRERILWSYIDTRDASVACRLAIEAEGLGSIALNLASDDSSMDIKSLELMAASYPEVQDFRIPYAAYETLLSNVKAKDVLNWQPVHSWRQHI